MRGLADGLDPSSAYLTPDEVRAIEAKAAPPAGDVGLVVTRQFYLRVVGVRDGSPAAKAGLQTGDFIRMIDDRATRDMSAHHGRAPAARRAGIEGLAHGHSAATPPTRTSSISCAGRVPATKRP